MRIYACHLSRGFDAGCSSTGDDNLAASCLDGWECFAQRRCRQGPARRECVGVLRHSRHTLAVSHTPQSIDQVIILHMPRVLLIHDHDLMVCKVETCDSSLEKLDLRSTQHLWKRAPLDHLIGGKLR